MSNYQVARLQEAIDALRDHLLTIDDYFIGNAPDDQVPVDQVLSALDALESSLEN